MRMTPIRACLAAALVIAANSRSAETADYVFMNGAVYTIDKQKQ